MYRIISYNSPNTVQRERFLARYTEVWIVDGESVKNMLQLALEYVLWWTSH